MLLKISLKFVHFLFGIPDYKDWKYKNKAEQGIIFPENIGAYLSINETCLSHSELYTILSNKSAKGKKGTIVVILKGTHSDTIIPLLLSIPIHLRKKVREVSLNLAGSMVLIVKKCFPHTSMFINRLYIQQLATEALQEIRIRHSWETIDSENNAIDECRKNKQVYIPKILNNGETLKQLLARSRYLLYKAEHNWTLEQSQRANILFERYPDIKKCMNYHKNYHGYTAIQKIKSMH